MSTNHDFRNHNFRKTLWKHFKIVIFYDNGPYCPFVWILFQHLYLDTYIFQDFNIIMFEIWQGINPMGLNASLANYLKKNTSQTWTFHRQP